MEKLRRKMSKTRRNKRKEQADDGREPRQEWADPEPNQGRKWRGDI